LPVDFQPELVVTATTGQGHAFVFSNGAQGCWLESTTHRLREALGRVVRRRCGRVNQSEAGGTSRRAAHRQGIGGALYEHCIYDDRGQLLNATMADYLVPMAAEMPDIVCGARRGRRRRPRCSARRAGEAERRRAGSDHERGQRRAAAARRQGDEASRFTPETVLKALRKVP